MPAPLRILQLAPAIYPTPPLRSGGTERVVHDLTEALIDAGHTVTLVAPADSRTRARLVPGYPSLAALSAKQGATPPGTPAMLEAVLLDRAAREAREHDIVHCHGEFAHAALFGAIGVPAVTTVHWRLDELDRQLFFGHFDALPVAAISASQASALPPANLAGIVHHGIAADRYHPGPGGGGLAFVGRMTDQKRPDRAIRVARAAGRPIRLAGGIDVGNPTYFETAVAPLLGDDAVHVGEIDDGAKQALLGDADALLMPIDWPEPFGLVMIEAMACGTPVIAWNRGSAAEIVEPGVTGFIVESEAEAAAAVAQLPAIDRRGVRARFEQRFTAARMAADYTSLYARLIAR